MGSFYTLRIVSVKDVVINQDFCTTNSHCLRLEKILELILFWGRSDLSKYDYCENHQYGVCNWLILESESPRFCKVCSFNRTIPDINNPEYRSLFGDKRKDYREALKEHCNNGTSKGWNKEYISAYASTHSWEDWAETWAHYLHIIDTVETAYAYGMSVHPATASNASLLHADINIDPYETRDFNKVLTLWFPLTFALNGLNLSMGLHDVYPFVIPAKVVYKLLFIHKVCFAARQGR